MADWQWAWERNNNESSAPAASSTPSYDSGNNWGGVDTSNTGDWGNTQSTSTEGSSKPKEETPQTPAETPKPTTPAQPVQQNNNAQQALVDTTSESYKNFMSNPDFREFVRMSDQNMYNQYMGQMQQWNTQQPTQTQTPQNPANVTSAQGVHYDPSQSYGRTADGKYTYSYSAQQLQNELARAGYYKGAIDGLFGRKTQEALNAYLGNNGGQYNATNGQGGSQDGGEKPSDSGSKAKSFFDDVVRRLQNTYGGDRNRDTASGNNSSNDQTPDRPMTGNSMSAALASGRLQTNTPNNYWDAMMTEGNEQAAPSRPMTGNSMSEALANAGQSNPRNIWEANSIETEPPADNNQNQGGSVLDELQALASAMGLAQAPVPEWSYNSGDTQEGSRTPIEYSDAFIRQQDQMDAYSPYASYNTQPSTVPLEYSDAFLRQQDMNDAYSPNQTFNDNYMAQLEAMQNPQRPSQSGDSMSRALADNQARPDTNVFRQDAPNLEEFRRQYEDAMALSQRAGNTINNVANLVPTEGTNRDERMASLAPQQATDIEALYDDYQSRVQQQNNNRELQYGRQFMDDMRQLRQQFPTYSDTALFDLALFNEEMRNGQSSYYKWLANQIG